MVFGDECMSKTRVFKWVNQFKEGWESVEDPHEGAPITSRTNGNVDHLHALMTSDGRLIICALCDELNINKKTVYNMLHKNLNTLMICTKMVPTVFAHEQKCKNRSARVCCPAVGVSTETG